MSIGTSVITSYNGQIKLQFDNLDLEVGAHGGLLTTDMRDLRDRDLAGKLGPHVVQSIADELKKRGLGHTDLSYSQWDSVRVWKQGTRVGKFIEAARHISKDDDETLRELVDTQSDEILMEIKKLVGA